jgi:excisionase family DNA binding protein
LADTSARLDHVRDYSLEHGDDAMSARELQPPVGGSKPAYTIEEASRASTVGRVSIYEEINAGKLKARKIGRRTVILHDDLMDWLASLPAFASQKEAVR